MRKGSNGRAGEEERIDALDFLARVFAHIPPPRIHLVRYLGHYSNVVRGGFRVLSRSYRWR